MSKKFKQFVTDKDKGKAPIKKIADYDGPNPNAPPGGAPYAATGEGGKAKKGAKVGDDWGDKGNKQLIYKPSIDQDEPDKTKGSDTIITVKEFVNRTKGLSSAQFAKYLAENNKDSGVIHESIEKTCNILAKNPNHTTDLVRELKRTGLLHRTVLECLFHQEGYEALAELMGNKECGENVCRRLVKAMNEMVGPPMHHGMHSHGNPQHHGMLNMGDNGMMGDPSGGGAKMSHPNLGHGMNQPPYQPNPDEDIDPDGDEMLHHGEGPDDYDDNSFGLDDEDPDEMGQGSDSGSLGTLDGQSGITRQMGVGGPRHRPEAPRPSMMSRMMRRENHSPAVDNFRKALLV